MTPFFAQAVSQLQANASGWMSFHADNEFLYGVLAFLGVVTPSCVFNKIQSNTISNYGCPVLAQFGSNIIFEVSDIGFGKQNIIMKVDDVVYPIFGQSPILATDFINQASAQFVDDPTFVAGCQLLVDYVPYTPPNDDVRYLLTIIALVLCSIHLIFLAVFFYWGASILNAKEPAK